MKTNLTVILSVAGVAALLASPAAATPVCPPNKPCQPRVVYVPVYVPDAYAYVPARGETRVAPQANLGIVPGINGVGPYTPAIPSPRYGDSGDFQSGGAESR